MLLYMLCFVDDGFFPGLASGSGPRLDHTRVSTRDTRAYNINIYIYIYYVFFLVFCTSHGTRCEGSEEFDDSVTVDNSDGSCSACGDLRSACSKVTA